MNKILSVFLVLIGTTEAVWATVTGPSPEVSGGILGMMAAAGAVYLVSRRKRR
jgi:LPXTG-motif cell wall-anchored protein